MGVLSRSCLLFTAITVAAAIGGGMEGCSKKAASTPIPTPTVTAGGSFSPCQSSNKNAFLTYGTAGFVALNNDIFAITDAYLATGGTALGTSFSKIGTGASGTATFDHASTFSGKLLAFLEFTYGGPTTIKVGTTSFDGAAAAADMQQEHTGLGITLDQYTFFLDDVITAAAATNGVLAEDMATCIGPALQGSAFEASIIGH